MRNAIWVIIVLAAVPCMGRVLTVGGDGSSDFMAIQTAIDEANDGDTVLIHPGEYVNGEHVNQSYQIINFKGKAITVTGTDPNDPDIVAQTIVDFNELFGGFVFGNDEDANSVLTGLTITGGEGFAISCLYSGPLIANCNITNNIAHRGAISMDCRISSPWYKSPKIVRCNISDNAYAAVRRGSGGNVVICDSVISGNGGAAIDILRGEISNCIISNNGGGIRFTESSETSRIVNSVIINNRAESLVRSGVRVVIENCRIVGNVCSEIIYSSGIDVFSLTVNNCLIAGNRAGTAFYLWGDISLGINGCTIVGNGWPCSGSPRDPCPFGGIQCNNGVEAVLTNSILRGVGDTGCSIALDETSMRVSHCNIQGGLSSVHVDSESVLDWGAGNIDSDPCFAETGYWDSNETATYFDDDLWVDGDYHLKSEGGRWDAGEGRWMRDEVTSPCIDAGDPMSPVGLEPFANGGIINMGAYGGTGEASKSYFGGPPCEIIMAGDVNGDCAVDFRDFQLMALHWMEER